MFMGVESVELIFELDALSAEEASRRSIEALGLQNSQFNVYQEIMSAKSALERISSEFKPFFNIRTADVSIHFSTIRAYRQQLLTISMREVRDLSVWQGIVGSFLSCKGFTQACLLSDEYTLWQNAADPIEYQAVGRSYEGLPLISNGLPNPLQKLVIDTSRNPGRRVIKIGYVEMVGCVMWLGRPFWNLVGNQLRQGLLASRAYSVTEMQGGIVRVVASEAPFVDETTKEAQEDLRRLLFG